MESENSVKAQAIEKFIDGWQDDALGLKPAFLS